ncbi:MAG: ATP synthase F0 subunit B [Deltaproteobacteria bacterium]|nr:ATP synthase F0 subunit B [Deltaproteobacteria bacterium]
MFRRPWIAAMSLMFMLFVGTSAGAGGHDSADGAESLQAEHHVVANPVENLARFDYKGKDTHGGPYEPEKGDHKMPAPFLGALFNFGILAFLIGKLAGPSVLRLVRDRHESIAQKLAESARLRDEAKRKLDEYTEKMTNLQAEIDRLVSELRSEAEKEKQRILSEAEIRAERMKKDAEQQISAEMTRVRVALEREAMLSAVALAEKILREKTTEADQQNMADRFVTDIMAQAGKAGTSMGPVKPTSGGAPGGRSIA